MRNKKIIYVLSVIGCLLTGCFIGVNANNINQEIKALLTYDVKIKYNNEYQTMYDANSVQVYPVNYQGTTYVPIRAVSKMFNIPVNWDAETRTVLLGNNSEWVNLTGENFKYEHNWYNNVLNVKVDDTTYKSGYKAESFDGAMMYVFTPETISLDSKYSDFSCIIVSEANKDLPVTLKVYDADSKEVIYEVDTQANSINKIDIDVTGRRAIGISMNGNYKIAPYGNTVYILDAKAK